MLRNEENRYAKRPKEIDGMFMANGSLRHRPAGFSRLSRTIWALVAGFAMDLYAADPGVSLCTPDEAVVFSCEIVGKKQAAFLM
jgi:hypothetical protein